MFVTHHATVPDTPGFRAVMQKVVGLTVLLALGASAACGSGDSEPVAVEWLAPDDYEFVLDSSCGEQDLIGRFRVRVGNGTVVEVEGLNERGRYLVASTGRDGIPTLTQLVALFNEAQERGADVATVAVDPIDGHPTRIDIDMEGDAVDDESCFVISDYVAPA